MNRRQSVIYLWTYRAICPTTLHTVETLMYQCDFLGISAYHPLELEFQTNELQVGKGDEYLPYGDHNLGAGSCTCFTPLLCFHMETLHSLQFSTPLISFA